MGNNFNPCILAEGTGIKIKIEEYSFQENISALSFLLKGENINVIIILQV